MTLTAQRLAVRRLRGRVEGTVQGVGFRPYVYRLAGELGLNGHVFNDARGVEVEVEAEAPAVARFQERLAAEAPPLARVERVSWRELPATGQRGFAIVASPRAGEPQAPVSPDGATCARCLSELLDPRDRRHRYPFINCTDCGPRFTIVRGVPYDRPLTTMAGFDMCATCRAEYEDPLDRRFHAQPNACPDCGPRVWLERAGGGRVDDREAGRDPVEAAARALAGGAIVAVKGVGGFHLACRADDGRAVGALRARKHREEKPFALMAPDLHAARGLAEIGPAEAELLLSGERPIVIAPRRPGAPVAAAVAPGTAQLGVMLPYSPLHHLLTADFARLAVEDAPGAGGPAVLVMTSGNVSDEPIAFEDDDARERLSGIADLLLLHDRPIETRTDDSVVAAVAVGRARRPLLLRRSRGHVPRSQALPLDLRRHVLACGAELKSTFCVAKGRRAWVSHHVGDLQNFETLRSFVDGVAHFQRLFAVSPRVVAHDLHPEYLSTRYALERVGVELVGVQHHHAHLAACLAEHGETGPALGAIYDGAGFGIDGTVWGGELLIGDLGAFARAGHLWPVRMPGGDQAAREPWRMACAWLAEAHEPLDTPPAAMRGEVSDTQWRAVTRMALTGISAPVTTSMGRLFDAVAALCGLRCRAAYEGQAATELQAAADPGESGAYPLPLVRSDGALVLDARETIRAVAADVGRGAAPGTISARFHAALARATADACIELAAARGLGTVVLSGGVFQNRLLLERTAALLMSAGVRVLIPQELPPNDGGIAFGQAAVAAWRDRNAESAHA